MKRHLPVSSTYFGTYAKGCCPFRRTEINIHNLGKLKPSKGSVSGALVRHIKSWTRRLSKENLEYFALNLPSETWRQLADICHLHPDKDFPNAPWFLRYCHDASAAPEGSLVKLCAGMTEANVNEYVAKVDVPFAHIKKFASNLSDPSKERIASYTKDLNTLLWNYEDLRCAAVDQVIFGRISAGEVVSLPYGKLVERLLYIRKQRRDQELRKQTVSVAPFFASLLPQAEKQLQEIKIALDSPIVVIGDASASMEVAIETSTIIGSFLRALTNAKLVFFSDDFIEPPFIPSTVEKVINLALTVKTVASTCHAAALWPFYEKREIVKTFIVTTDEEENKNIQKGGQSYNFQSLFTKYHAEVYPARLVFVSFLRSQHSKGQMVEPLKAAGFNVLQFKFDGARPDLTKLDNIVGQLAMGNVVDFDQQVAEIERTLKQQEVDEAAKKIEQVNISSS